MKTTIQKSFSKNVNTLKKTKKVIRYITDHLEIFSDDSDKED